MFGTIPVSFRSSPDVVVLREGDEGVVELAHELDRHRVEAIRTVQPHRRDVGARTVDEHET
jgi:radical SAM superfamily enzyme YgiQ (UPF0313 family)